MDSFWAEYPRDVVRIVGADAATYLQSQVSQDLRQLAVGASVWSFVLEPAGKIDALMRIFRVGEEEFVLDTDSGTHAIAELPDLLMGFKNGRKVFERERPTLFRP